MGSSKLMDFKKCGDILISRKALKNKSKLYTFRCGFCSVDCDQLKKFSKHLEENHLVSIEDEVDQTTETPENSANPVLIFEPEEIKIEPQIDIDETNDDKKLSTYAEGLIVFEDPLEAGECLKDNKVKEVKNETNIPDREKQIIKDDTYSSNESDKMDYDDSFSNESDSATKEGNRRATKKTKRRLTTTLSEDFLSGESTDDDLKDADFEIENKLNSTKKQQKLKKEVKKAKQDTNVSKEKEQKENELINICDIKEKLMSGIFKITLKRGHSKIWNIIGQIDNENGEEIKGVVGCRHCFAVLKYDPRSTSNLNKHKCYIESQKNSEKIIVSGNTKKEAVKFCTEWIVQNCRPFGIVEDKGFKKVCELCVSVGAKYGQNVNMDHLIPDHSTISRNVDKLYQKYFVNIKDMISNMKCGFAITADLWTDNFLRKTYLGVTMHSILRGKLINIVVGLQSMDDDKCTAQNIIAKTQNLLNEFDCQLDVKTTIVTDRGKNMVAAFRDYSRINCINHLLHNVIQKSVESVTSVADLYKACSDLVDYFKKSGLNARLSKCLQSFSSTRWNTVYYMFESVGKNWEEIVCILQKNRQINRIHKINHSYVIAMAYILEPFEKASKMLEGADYPTLHYVLIYIKQLRKKCSINDSDLDIIKDFKHKVIENFEAIVLQNLSMLHNVALFLFPPANKLRQFTDDERSSIKLECSKLMEEMYQPSQYTPNNQSALSAENLDLLGDFLQPNHVEDVPESLAQEIARYENLNVCMVDDFNILKWWESRKMQFPNLYSLSCKILCIPASSAPSERIFFNSRQALSETRSVLGRTSEKVQQLIFVHENVNICDLSNEINKLED